MLMVKDAARALDFYRDGLGAEIRWAADDGSWSGMSIGGREVCLHGNGTGALTDTGLALEVEDLEQACSAVEAAGGQVLRPHEWDDTSGNPQDPGEWLAIVTDTEGNRICMVRKGGCFLHPSLFPVA
jgi:predicted enzyme related to lactoylglutathione lyase